MSDGSPSETTIQTSTNDKEDLRSDYWNDYYVSRSTGSRLVPSQFAAFVAGEMSEPHRVVEFGCAMVATPSSSPASVTT